MTTLTDGLASREPAVAYAAGVNRCRIGLGDLALHSWPKDLAPSTELRRWYGHRPERFDEFRRRYLQELAEPEAARALGHLVQVAAQHPVVLLTATRDIQHSEAAVLAAVVAGSPA